MRLGEGMSKTKKGHQNNCSILELYGKLYFHEIESRERLDSRLQLPLALIVSIIGVISFLIQNVELGEWKSALIFFIVITVSSIISLISCIYFFIRSWYNNTYYFLPSARDSENYRKTLLETYKNQERGDELANKYFDEYLVNTFIECSTKNTSINDERSVNIHKTNGLIIITAIFSSTFFILFRRFIPSVSGRIELSKTKSIILLSRILSVSFPELA